MNSLQFYSPTKIVFGEGMLEEGIATAAEEYPGKALIVTTGPAMKQVGWLDRVSDAWRNYGECEVFEGISANPKLDEIGQAVRFAQERGLDTVIGLGGGSAIDAAKCIAVGVGTHTDDLTDYLLDGATPPPETLPIIAIPTTAGTGAEVSKGAILTSNQHSIKTGVRGENIFPKIAIVDPTMTLTLPWAVTVESGFDAFAHAIETYISTNANPITELLSLYAIREIAEALPQLRNHPDDLHARSRMSFASMLMGINLANSRTCLPHRMQYVIGALTDTSHGAGLACLFPAWVRNGYSASPEKFTQIGQALEPGSASSAAGVTAAVMRFLDAIDFHVSLGDLGLSRDQLPLLVSKASSSSDDPTSALPGIVSRVFDESF